MNHRGSGKTGPLAGEIGFGAEWMERHSPKAGESSL